MKTFTTLKNLFTNLSQNNSTANDTLGGQLISDQQRYLIQKYFDNEKTVTATTVGSSAQTVTVAPAIGDVSATLSSAWTNLTGYSPTNFSSGEQRNILYTNGSTAITWAEKLTKVATTSLTSLGFQYYLIPGDVSKITNDTINVGQQKFTPRFVQTRDEWDGINYLPYNSDIPSFCFIYNGQLGIFPIPSTTGNILTFNYKSRVADLSFADYTTPGTITTMTAGSTAVVGNATTWAATLGVPTGVDITRFNLYLRADPPKGDGIWYLIRSITDATNLVLANPAINTTTTGATFTIGQMPVLLEDFHDMLVYGALMTYFSSINKDTNSYNQMSALYKTRLELLADYAGTKSVNVNLGDTPMQQNANLYIYANS